MSSFHRCFQNVNSLFKNMSMWWPDPFKPFFAMLGIRIRRIIMFLGFQDPVRGTDPDPAPDPSLFLYNACKIEFLQKIKFF